MEALHFFRRLYSLDTLDTRLTTSSSTPLTVVSCESPEKATSGKGVETQPASLPPGASPSKWQTLEFYAYYAIFLLAVPQMFRSVMNVSSRGSSHGSNLACASSKILQLHIQTTPNTKTFSPPVGFPVAKLCVKIPRSTKHSAHTH
jgi:hypothetical protein